MYGSCWNESFERYHYHSQDSTSFAGFLHVASTNDTFPRGTVTVSQPADAVKYIPSSTSLIPTIHTAAERERKVVNAMLGWALMFFVIAIIAGIFGFFGIAAAAAGIAKILFVAFLVLFVIFLILGRRTRVN